MTKVLTVFLFYLLAGYTSCAQEMLDAYPYNSYRVSLGGCGTRDSIALTRVADHLYADENGRLYLWAMDCSDEGSDCKPMFIARFVHDCDPEVNDNEYKKYDLAKRIDVETFRFLGNGYYADKNNAYHHEVMADGGHLSFWKHDFPYKDYAVSYGCYAEMVSTFFIYAGPDLYYDASGRLYFGGYYFKGKEKTPIFLLRFGPPCTNYDGGCDSTCDIINLVDLEGFEKSGDGFYRDRYRKYDYVEAEHGGYFIIVQNDPETFTAIGNGYYRGAEGHIYVSTSLLRDVDTDKWSEPFLKELPHMDGATFVSYGNDFAKDKNHVYYTFGTTDGLCLWVLEGADPSGFEHLADSWAMDQNHVFYERNILPGVDPRDFKLQHRFWGTSKTNVFYSGKVLEGLHPDSTVFFEFETDGGADPQAYGRFAKDKNQLYFYGNEVTGVDVASFEAVVENGHIVYRDKDWSYTLDYFYNADVIYRSERAK